MPLTDPVKLTFPRGLSGYDPMRRLLIVLLAVAGLGAGAAIAWWSLRPGETPPEASEDDPRITFPAASRNVRPGVQYVGDAVCAQCHQTEVASYTRHPMGRSLGPTADLQPVEQYGTRARDPFEVDGFRFEVERNGSRMIHRQIRPGADGAAPVRLECDVHFAVGSGARGRTYLVERDGRLFQSPISWFSSKGIWDLTPGFRALEQFGRPADAKCLFCHCNAVEPVAHALNQYRPPQFRGHAIGCERCHGPGELHVGSPTRGDGSDETIVNPGRLEPALRDAVCEQCHLQGEARVVRRGRELFDYRPGLPLHLFLSVFTKPGELTGGAAVGGHAEQMRDSRCFQASGGRLGCISCHDPHSVPGPQKKIAHYRDRCLQCHADRGCSLAPAERRQRSPADSCIDCHMPRAESPIAHTAAADHRIVRRPSPPAPPRPPRPGEIPLRHFHDELVEPHDPEVSRDLGVALAEVGLNNPQALRAVAPHALPLLDAAVVAHSDDVAAREARGYTRWFVGRPADGLMDMEAVLGQVPERESALTYAAALATALGRDGEAIGYWRSAVAVNPWTSIYRSRLAKLLTDRGDWAGALVECEAALRINPFDNDARALRSRCLREPGVGTSPR